MEAEYNIEAMAEKIRLMRRVATELKGIAGGIPAVEKNVDRILASVRVLEINISDLGQIEA